MKKISTPYLEDILRAISLIEQYLGEVENQKETFLSNIQLQDAVVRRLEIIGEATKRLEHDFRQENNQIPWKLMAGLRDILVHEYDEVDLLQIWKVIDEDLSPLKKLIEQLLVKQTQG